MSYYRASTTGSSSDTESDFNSSFNRVDPQGPYRGWLDDETEKSFKREWRERMFELIPQKVNCYLCHILAITLPLEDDPDTRLKLIASGKARTKARASALSILDEFDKDHTEILKKDDMYRMRETHRRNFVIKDFVEETLRQTECWQHTVGVNELYAYFTYEELMLASPSDHDCELIRMFFKHNILDDYARLAVLRLIEIAVRQKLRDNAYDRGSHTGTSSEKEYRRARMACQYALGEGKLSYLHELYDFVKFGSYEFEDCSLSDKKSIKSTAYSSTTTKTKHWGGNVRLGVTRILQDIKQAVINKLPGNAYRYKYGY